jgi:hypothetical protein
VRVPVKAVGTAGQSIATTTVSGVRAVKDFLAKPFSKEKDYEE